MIEVNNVFKIIKNKVILNNISFTVKKNTIFGIVGPNGSGKTTLLKIILGLYSKSSGNISINTNEIGSAIDTNYLCDHMNAIDNLKMICMIKNININKIQEVLKKVSLTEYKNVIYKNFSLGMKQRLSISAAIIDNPSLLILDEPTNGLDPIGIIELRNFLRSLKNTTIIISTHMLSELESLCDEVLFLNNGMVLDVVDLRKEKNIKLEDKFLKIVCGGEND